MLGVHQINGPSVSSQEVSVVALFIDDDFDHPQCQRGVGAGNDRDPLIGLGGGFVKAGIDHHQPRASFLRLNIFFEIGLHGHGRIIAPAQNVAAVGNGVAHICVAQAKHRDHGGGHRRAA
ncbi:hypothetical protein D3C71_1291350 [compost metagenome]